MKRKDILIAAWISLSFLIIYLVCVILADQVYEFHGLLVRGPMFKDSFFSFRTALAGVSMFAFFPIVWFLNRRSNETEVKKWRINFYVLQVLAQFPVLCGLGLFVFFGAFKTFFVFLLVSFFYHVIVWPFSDFNTQA